jgi:hypothetical protein
MGGAQRLLRIDEEAPLEDQKIALLEQRVSNLVKENDLLKQQNAIQEKLTELAKREAEVYRIAFEKEKELTDRHPMPRQKLEFQSPTISPLTFLAKVTIIGTNGSPLSKLLDLVGLVKQPNILMLGRLNLSQPYPVVVRGRGR